FEQAADLGDSGAMFNLGVLLAGSDPGEARRRYEQAADLGHSGAMNNLGAILASSDPDEARQRYEQAADLGHTGAMFNLGVLLEGSDPGEARRRYEQAADLGHTGAMTNLGAMLEDSDREKAIGWYTKAAAAGRPVAMNNLAELLIKEGDVAAARRWAESLASSLTHGEGVEELIAEQLRTSLTEIERMLGRPSAEIDQQQPEGSPQVADRRATPRSTTEPRRRPHPWTQLGRQ
ncbi:MAG TPA: tetratricopeptide repeat protein, partial [Dermatophilaceae bacterium]